jgi:predicted nucleic acid-binding protein
MFLLDTNVVSETIKRRPNPGVTQWLDQTDTAGLWLCTITIGEITKGIALLRKREPERAKQLLNWRTKLEAAYTDRILPFDTQTSHQWGEIRASFPSMSLEDSIIASIAQVRGLTIVTRNTRDFAATGLPIVNPFRD